jgi:uroporphyrinogen-III synthase
MSVGARIAVTRALPEAATTAARLTTLGARPIVAPLLTIVPRLFDPSIAGAQALAFTSINGIRAFAAASAERTLPVFCVGPATATAAKDAAFVSVTCAGGDVASLAALIAATLNPAAGPIVHIAGEHIAGDLAGELAAASFAAERRIAYSAEAVTALPSAFADPVDVVLFYSARAAHTFAALGAPRAAAMTAACMSEGVAAEAAKIAWTRIVVAPAPREDALFTALGLV